MFREIKEALVNKNEGHLFPVVIGNTIKALAFGGSKPTGDKAQTLLHEGKMYREITEAGVNDLPKHLGGSILNRSGYSMPEQMNSNWQAITKISSVKDFRQAERIGMSGFSDWDRVADKDKEPAGYNEDKLQENSYIVQLDTRGKKFTVSRKMLMNDDLNGLADVAMRLGISCERTKAKQAVNILESDQIGYDGSTRLFTSGSNLEDTALADTIAGRTAVKAGTTYIRTSTDPNTGEKIGLVPVYLVVAANIADAAFEIAKSVELRQVSTSGGGTYNALQYLQPLVIPQLADDSWYISSGKQVLHPIEMVVLNGKETPDILVSAPQTTVVGGGSDPYSMDFDDITYKGRHDFAFRACFQQTIYKGK